LLRRPWLRFTKDFKQHRPDAEVPLALGAAAGVSFGSVTNQVFELFAHDVIFIRGPGDARLMQSTLRHRQYSIQLGLWFHLSTSVSALIDVVHTESGTVRIVNMSQQAMKKA
jgi:hypothetical protein